MPTAAPDQVQRIVENQHQNPFEVLGSHKVGENGQTKWVVRAYLPDAQAAWVIHPEERTSYPMESVHHPHFFECQIETEELASNYLLKVKEGDRDRFMYDPYAFKTPLFTEYDIYLFGEGNHHRIYEKMGAHVTTVDGVQGVYFAVWAPGARNVSVIGNFNLWDGRKHQMRQIGGGVWDLFIPEIAPGEKYKYEIKNPEGHLYYKSDPYGYQQEVRPDTASIVNTLDYTWQDETWMNRRRDQDPQEAPISVYEVHLGSWLHASAEEPPEQGYVVGVSQKPGGRFLTYRELAHKLVPYVKELGYTHIELLPIAEHPFDGSWGYQAAIPNSKFDCSLN